MGLATLNEATVTNGLVSIPYRGRWFADVSLDREVQISGQATLRVMDAEMRCTIIRGGTKPGARSSYRVVGGYGKWGRSVKKKGYTNDAGVKVATIVEDAARDAGGEIVESPPATSRVGTYFARTSGPACRVLELVAPDGWHVGVDGVTRFGARSAATVSSTYATLRLDRGAGEIQVKPTGSIKQFVPGCTVDGHSLADVDYEIEPNSISVKAFMARQKDSRALSALRAMMEQVDPRMPYRGLHEYRVVTQTGNKFDLQAVNSTVGMPDLQRVPFRSSVAGAKGILMPGTRVIVAFVSASPSSPFIVAVEDYGGGFFKPVSMNFDANTIVTIGSGATPVAHATQTLAIQSATAACIAAVAAGFNALGPIPLLGTVAGAVVTAALTPLTAAIATNAPTLPTTKGMIQ